MESNSRTFSIAGRKVGIGEPAYVIAEAGVNHDCRLDRGQALVDTAGVTAKGQPVHVAYVNPETGMECLPTLGFSALMLRPGEELKLPRRSASSVMHVVEGGGTAFVDDATLPFGEADTFAVPTHADVRLANASSKTPAFVFVVDDAPLHRKLGFYEVFE